MSQLKDSWFQGISINSNFLLNSNLIETKNVAHVPILQKKTQIINPLGHLGTAGFFCGVFAPRFFRLVGLKWQIQLFGIFQLDNKWLQGHLAIWFGSGFRQGGPTSRGGKVAAIGGWIRWRNIWWILLSILLEDRRYDMTHDLGVLHVFFSHVVVSVLPESCASWLCWNASPVLMALFSLASDAEKSW